MQYFYKILATFFIVVFLFTQASFCTQSFVWDDSILATNGDNATGNFLNLESGSAILIEQNSGKFYMNTTSTNNYALPVLPKL